MATYTTNNTNSSGGYSKEVIGDLIKEEFSNNKDSKQAMDSVVDKLGLKDNLIVFFGFQGILANTFSMIKTSEQEEIKMRCFAMDDTVSPVFMNIVDFYDFHNKYDVPAGNLKTMKIEDAMSALRLGEKLNRSEDKFEDVEMDEFDDDCTEECIPGSHKCGKK